MKTGLILAAAWALGAAPYCEARAQTTAGLQVTSYSPVTQEMLVDPDPADWLQWRGNYQKWGYSPLDQIDRDNVSDLRLAWSYAFRPGDPGSRGLQGEPVVHDGIMFVRDANEVYTAHDATTGDVIWRYARTLPEDIAEFIDDIHRGRGMALYQDMLISHSTDGHLFALDARTGELLWDRAMTAYDGAGGAFGRGHQPSGAPVVFNGIVAVPYNCTADDSPDPCHMSGYAAATGELVWRWYTSPTREDAMHSTWGSDPQVIPLERRRNMSPWMSLAVDTERGLFIFGIGSSAPQQPALAGTDGQWPDRLYHGSTVALDHRTGRLEWWAQHVTDMWNDDSVFDRILVDSPVDPDPPEALGVNPDVVRGERREMVVGSFSKDGIFYAYDRTDGTFLYARPTGYQNVIQGYDGRTGAYTINPEAVMGADLDRQVRVCLDSRTVPPGAYSPLTNAYYVPAWNGRCQIVEVTSLEPSIETGYNTSFLGGVPNPMAHEGQPEAIDVATGKSLWRLDRDARMYGMLTTGGGLLFVSDQDRRFFALDQRTGETVWETILASSSYMGPISYAVNGRQYVAVIAPGGGVPPAQAGVGHTLFVFALPGR